MKVTEVILEGVARAMGGDYTVEKAVKAMPNGETMGRRDSTKK